MAETLPDYDWDQKVMRTETYPWETWLDGNSWLLTKGVDFNEDPDRFRRAAYARAKYHGYQIRTRTITKGQKILIQKVSPSDEPDADEDRRQIG